MMGSVLISFSVFMVRITPSILSEEETHKQMQIIVAAASSGKNKIVCKCASRATERRGPERQANNHGEVVVGEGQEGGWLLFCIHTLLNGHLS